MYLEPDERDGYGYLEAVFFAKKHYKEYLIKYESQKNNYAQGLFKEYKILTEKCDRYESYWRILDAWLSRKEDGVSLESYFLNNGINVICVYGGGMLGKHLLEELYGGKVKIAGVIDRKGEALKLRIPVYLPEEKFPESDAIIVTSTYAYREIKEQLEHKGYNNIISLENIVMGY